jgi:hypothetical protein
MTLAHRYQRVQRRDEGDKGRVFNICLRQPACPSGKKTRFSTETVCIAPGGLCNFTASGEFSIARNGADGEDVGRDFSFG